MAEPVSAPAPVVENPAPVAPVQSAPVAPVASVAPVQSTPAPVLPQEVNNKTKEQFDKLLESNRRLFESNESLRRQIIAREQSNQTFAPIQQVPTVPKPQVNAADFVEVDPLSGESFINTDKMKSKMDDINQRASRAEQAIQNYIKSAEQKEIERQSNETFAVYPELNPGNKEKFNEGFNKQVRGILLDSMYSPSEYGGRPLTFKEAADFTKKISQPTPTVPTPVVKEDKKGQDNKIQGSTQVPSQPGNLPEPTSDQELERLRVKTRYGDNEALAKRLLSTEHILPGGSS